MAVSPAAQDPRKRPQQRRSRATVEKILAAAAHVLAEEGTSATTDRIAARAGVSIGSLYQYFPNKGALILELARLHMAQAGEVLDHVLRPGRPRSVWLPEAVAAVAAMHEDGDLHRVLYDHAASTPALAEAFEQTNEALRARVEELLRAEEHLADPGTTAQVLVALVESLSHRLVGTTDFHTLAREVTRAAAAYLDAACRPVVS
ncbi:TetR/AcrR family transcriptional regulator [Ornithinimicrobium panacihumi]|uniref:TetR/AcrR family transcriptional regulator n=1 Tax=Ornithinimicrobium panacihumi TaxID=2008449 RepID=UPI003F8A7FD3